MGQQTMRINHTRPTHHNIMSGQICLQKFEHVALEYIFFQLQKQIYIQTRKKKITKRFSDKQIFDYHI